MDKILSNYEFFVQPLVDNDSNQIAGYEFLLREQTSDGWMVPKNFEAVDLKKQVELFEQAMSRIGNSQEKELVVSFNLNRKQAQDPSAPDQMAILQSKIKPAHLVIEFTESITLDLMKQYSLFLHQNDIVLTIDDVGTGSNTFANVESQLPLVDKIKFAMQNYREEKHADVIRKDLTFWREIARKYDLVTVLEGIETESDRALAQEFNVDLQQGYLYGKPTSLQS